jgi:hypothetical protein
VPAELRCPECGSTDIARSAQVGPAYGGGNLAVALLENPRAKFFVGRTRHLEIKANVCCQCGFVKLFVEDPQQIGEFPRDQSR